MDAISRTAKDALQAKFSAFEAGYHPIERSETYGRLLQMAGEAFGLGGKRQSPLINAGYGVRVALVLDQIYTFTQYHAEPINLIVLGAGLDVAGLWALSSSQCRIHLIEVDQPEICEAKKDFLAGCGVLKTAGEGDVVSTLPCLPECRSDSSYSLLQADLENLEVLSKKLEDAIGPERKPTLVISELVVTYLNDVSRQELFRYCATKLCSCSGSAMVLYEPMGPEKPSNLVLDSFKNAYSDQFSSKLEKGIADNRQCRTKFSPLATSPEYMVDILESAGFECSRAESARNAAISLRRMHGRDGFRVREEFAEYAAVSLHLQTYGLFVGASSGDEERNLIDYLCPWNGMVRPTTFAAGNSEVLIRDIGSKHDIQIREIFTQIYKPHFDEYPAIRKMHNSALKSGLLASSCDGLVSEIGQRFRNQSGFFLVALSGGTVLGGIGIRKCMDKESGLRKGSCEVHHLLVCENFRRRGIARALSRAAENMLDCPKLVATTLSTLTEANSFYLSEGYTLHDENRIGQLSTSTYAKSI